MEEKEIKTEVKDENVAIEPKTESTDTEKEQKVEETKPVLSEDEIKTIIAKSVEEAVLNAFKAKEQELASKKTPDFMVKEEPKHEHINKNKVEKALARVKR